MRIFILTATLILSALQATSITQDLTLFENQCKGALNGATLSPPLVDRQELAKGVRDNFAAYKGVLKSGVTKDNPEFTLIAAAQAVVTSRITQVNKERDDLRIQKEQHKIDENAYKAKMNDLNKQASTLDTLGTQIYNLYSKVKPDTKN